MENCPIKRYIRSLAERDNLASLSRLRDRVTVTCHTFACIGSISSDLYLGRVVV